VDGCSVQVKGTGGGDIGGVREKLSERTKVSSDMYTRIIVQLMCCL